jgi:hypothetical protein
LNWIAVKWPGRRAFALAARATLFFLLLSLVAGCGGSGVRWRVGLYRDNYDYAQREQKLSLVYFRNWYSVDCTNFEERVLKDPEVVAETRDMVCTLLEYGWYKDFAGKWGLTEVPAFAIVSPDGEVIARGQGAITRAELLDALRQAKGTMTPESAPATAPG